MTKQFNIRNDKAYELAVSLSDRLGKPMHKVVEEALAAFDANHPSNRYGWEEWKRLLEPSWASLRESKSDFRIEDLYDSETGLPV